MKSFLKVTCGVPFRLRLAAAEQECLLSLGFPMHMHSIDGLFLCANALSQSTNHPQPTYLTLDAKA